MFSPRSFRLRRRLALCLALATILATLAPPLQASPLDRAAIQGPVLGLIDWVQGLLLGIGAGSGQENYPEGPQAIFLPEGTCHDPDGVPIPCPKKVILEAPTNPRSERLDPRDGHLKR